MKTKNPKYWTKEEDNYLRENYKTKTIEELSAHFGRTVKGVKTRVRRLKITKRNFTILEDWQKSFMQLACFDFSYPQIAEYLGIDLCKVKKFMNLKLGFKRGRLASCGIGTKIGPLTIVGYKGIENRQRIWFCECEHCHQIKEVSSARLGTFKNSCGCLNYTVCGDITGTLWCRITKSAQARSRELDFTINMEYASKIYEDQSHRCKYTDKELYIDKTVANQYDTTASLDRIDSSRGYVEGNVQWLHKDVNIMKMDFDEPYFIRTCGEIWRHSWRKAYPGSLEDCFGSHEYDWV